MHQKKLSTHGLGIDPSLRKEVSGRTPGDNQLPRDSGGSSSGSERRPTRCRFGGGKGCRAFWGNPFWCSARKGRANFLENGLDTGNSDSLRCLKQQRSMNSFADCGVLDRNCFESYLFVELSSLTKKLSSQFLGQVATVTVLSIGSQTVPFRQSLVARLLRQKQLGPVTLGPPVSPPSLLIQHLKTRPGWEPQTSPILLRSYAATLGFHPH